MVVYKQGSVVSTSYVASDTATSNQTVRSEVETSVQYDVQSSNGSASEGALTFGILVKRMIHFAREEIAKHKADSTSDDDAFRAFGTTYCPMPAKLTGLAASTNTVTLELGEKPHIKNVLFVFRVLTLALRRQRLREDEEAEARAGIGGIFEELPSGSGGPSFAEMQLIMARSQAAALIVETIAFTRYATLSSAVLTFGTELFFNGFRVCQDALLEFLTNGKASGHFFCRLEHMIVTITQARRDINALRSAAMDTGAADRDGIFLESRYFSSIAPPAVVVYELYRFLQLLCEGHYSPMQELLDDMGNTRAGLLSSSLQLLNEYVPTVDDIGQLRTEDGAVVYAILNFLVESVQGPCYKNQELLASLPIFWEIIDRIWRFSSNEWDIKKEKLHECIDIKRLLDSHGDKPLGFHAVKRVKTMAMILRCSLIEGRKPSRSDPVFKVLMMYNYR